MQNNEDRQYYLHRARRERVIADIVEDRAAVRAHMSLAEEYERRAAACLEHGLGNRPAHA